MWQNLGLTLLVIVATLLCVLLFMLFGWFVVWRLFLSKFKFLRELVGDTGTRPEPELPATRTRNRTARQRVSVPDSNS